MISHPGINSRVAWLVVVMCMAAGCATRVGWYTTEYGTMEYSRGDLERLPGISIRNILASGRKDENIWIQVFVEAEGIEGWAAVRRLEGDDAVRVVDAQGREGSVALAQITTIRRVRRLWQGPREKTGEEKAAEAIEVLEYAPLVPLAILSWPILSATGLDAQKNADDEEKAELAYGGLSREQLLAHVGQPREQYFCREVKGGTGIEIWVYDDQKVLRGGRAMFISLRDGDVYSTSVDTKFFREPGWLDCRPMADDGTEGVPR